MHELGHKTGSVVEMMAGSTTITMMITLAQSKNESNVSWEFMVNASLDKPFIFLVSESA
jgi:hypothetical protein